MRNVSAPGAAISSPCLRPFLNYFHRCLPSAAENGRLAEISFEADDLAAIPRFSFQAACQMEAATFKCLNLNMLGDHSRTYFQPSGSQNANGVRSNLQNAMRIAPQHFIPRQTNKICLHLWGLARTQAPKGHLGCGYLKGRAGVVFVEGVPPLTHRFILRALRTRGVQGYQGQSPWLAACRA